LCHWQVRIGCVFCNGMDSGKAAVGGPVVSGGGGIGVSASSSGSSAGGGNWVEPLTTDPARIQVLIISLDSSGIVPETPNSLT
jgi:hypothetical protein